MTNKLILFWSKLIEHAILIPLTKHEQDKNTKVALQSRLSSFLFINPTLAA
jgi:hypothetical protein